MRILFSAAPWAYGNGPIGQCLEVARNARIRGHICQFVACPRTRQLVEQEHFEIVEMLNAQNNGEYPNVPPIFFSDFLAAGGFLSDSFVAETFEQEIALLKKIKPDAIFSIWHVTLHAIAELLAIPVFASTFYPDHPHFSTPLFPELTQKAGEVERVLNRQMRRFGVGKFVQLASDLIFNEPTVPICAFPKGFDYLLETHCKRVHVVGPVVHDYEAYQNCNLEVAQQNVAQDNYCLVYLPEIHTFNWISSSDSTACIRNYVQPMLAPASKMQQAPPGWLLCLNISFLDAIAGAKCFVCHGGFGSILMALKRGCPILAIPGNDPEREYVSGCVERLELGVVLKELSTRALDRALHTLMQASVLSKTLNYSNRFCRENGAVNIVKLIEKYSFRSREK